MYRPFLLVFLFLLAFSSCKLFKDFKFSGSKKSIGVKPFEISDYKSNLIKNYRSSRKIDNKLVHTKLDVQFDLQKCYLFGKAWITLTPNFNQVDNLTLDSKWLTINKLELVGRDSNLPLEYTYDSLQIKISLNGKYSKNEKYTIYIEYISKPNEIQIKPENSSFSGKGLYFINPAGNEPDKPQQIWTQGETEGASCWFPTIDAPNQRCSQELLITVNKKFKTLSNGLLINSSINPDSSRTDYWKQDKPHAPYLFMMAVGDYSIVHDSCGKIPISYYVEPKYEAYAKDIFGRTPEMLEFYSKLFGINYPWDKYAQVVVRDYISGAMENTSATVMGDFAQRTSRELIDDNSDPIIAHELSHQWFGNLVTCESWSNLPLNESFATYAEYLWEDYKCGRYEADQYLQNILDGYIRESKYKKENLIRFYYKENDDMFDTHSYNKGGCVLHMLRNYLGDSIFFEGCKTYLQRYKFKSVEIHDLRLVYEEISGEDLNWFFNQWFLSPGHPELEIGYDYDQKSKSAKVTIEQKQNLSYFPLYKLPVKIDFYLENEVISKDFMVENQKQIFEFKCEHKPLLINFDAEKKILCTKLEHKSENEFIVQYNRAPLYLDKFEALDALKSFTDSKNAKEIFLTALDHDFWYIRYFAIQNYNFKGWQNDELFLNKIQKILQYDPKSKVRAAAVTKLSETKSEEIIGLFKKIIKSDSSALVINSVTNGIRHLNPKESMQMANEFANEKIMLNSVLSIYKDYGDSTKACYFEKAFIDNNGYVRWNIMESYADFIVRFDEKTLDRGLNFFQDIAYNGNPWWVRGGAMQAIVNVANHYKLKIKQLDYVIANSDKKDKTTFYAIGLYMNKERKIKEMMDDIKSKEKNDKLLEWYKNIYN